MPDSKTGHSAVSSSSAQEQSQDKPKPCCSCPETRRARDECIMEKGEENCKEFIEAHRACMKKLGFDV